MNAPKKSPPQAQAQQKLRQLPSQSHRPTVLQPKAAVPPPVKKAPAAPPVYRPHPTPKVLQTKKAGVQKPPAAPAVYRPEVKKIVQPKITRAVPGANQVKSSLHAAPASPLNLSQARLAKTPTSSVIVQMRRRRRGLPGSEAAKKREERKERALKQEEEAAIKKRQRAANNDQATFLMETTGELFTKAKAKNSKLMEVQSGIIGDKMFLVSNYSRGAGDAMSKSMEESYSYTHSGATYEYTGKGLLTREGTLHSEQQVLLDLARTLKNPRMENPRHVTVVGTKRPCSTCRRVLLAFDRALHRHYPEVHLHFIDKTGQDTDVDALDLKPEKSPTDGLFNAFVDTYDKELTKYLGYRARTLEGEEGSSGERMLLKPALEDLT